MSKRGVAATLLAVGLTGTQACGSSGDKQAAPHPTSTQASASASVALTVKSSIPEGAALAAALPWEASVTVAGADSVSRVEFAVDGKVRWTEQNEPYFFNDDAGVLPPWLLGSGPHTLSVHAVSGGGAEATSATHVTVRADTSANAGIAGTYRRTVTEADARRVASYRTEDKGAFGEVPPPGEWTIKVSPTGNIEGHDPVDATMPFEEPFTVTGNHLRLYGPAVWLQPDPSKPNLFCEPERPSDYAWKLSGKNLTLAAVQQVCADRDTVIVGTWTKTGT